MQLGIVPGLYFDFGRPRELPMCDPVHIVGTSSSGPVRKPIIIRTMGQFYYYLGKSQKMYERVTAKNLRLLAKKSKVPYEHERR